MIVAGPLVPPPPLLYEVVGTVGLRAVRERVEPPRVDLYAAGSTGIVSGFEG